MTVTTQLHSKPMTIMPATTDSSSISSSSTFLSRLPFYLWLLSSLLLCVSVVTIRTGQTAQDARILDLEARVMGLEAAAAEAREMEAMLRSEVQKAEKRVGQAAFKGLLSFI